MFLSIGMLKQKYFLTDIFILSAEKQPIKLSWRKIEWLQQMYILLGNCVKKGRLRILNQPLECCSFSAFCQVFIVFCMSKFS